MRRVRVAAVVCGVVTAACNGASGGNSAATMPHVVGERLDVAKSDLKHIGVSDKHVEVVGGGTFGVLDESNWVVCRQDPEAGADHPSDVRLIVDRGCTTTDIAGSQSSTTATGGVPNVVTVVLSDAKRTLSAAGYSNITSHDASGKGRSQIIDSNWTVCSQQPGAGSAAPTSTQVDLAVVKTGESCP